MYLITLRLLTRGSVKLHKEVMLSYNSQRAFKEKKRKVGDKKQERVGKKIRTVLK